VRSAVDTSVLLDVFSDSPTFVDASRALLLRALSDGSLVACDVVWAETRAHFASHATFEKAVATLGIAFDPCDAHTASLAGEAWKRYREDGGTRTVLVPDLLVAAHASIRADRLLTRDRGFTRRYFRRLTVLDPSR
jgi:predicted nucleic acid-binding protein